MARKLVVEVVGDATSLERSFARAAGATNRFDRDIGRASRGALAGSGAFRAMGRSIAFASAEFLGFAAVGQLIRKSVDAAKEAAVAQAQLAAQFQAAGQNLSSYQNAIDQTLNRLSALSGFQNDELKTGFTTIFRTTRNVGKSLRDLALAADLARARHIGLAQAATIVAKTEAGNTTLLRRQGIQIAKNATVEQALAAAHRATAGQAEAGTTAQERFGAVLHTTEEIIGNALLPTLNRYLEAASSWLETMNESGKLQKDVAKTAHGVATAFRDAAGVIRAVDKVTGGFKHTLELLAALKIASVLSGFATSIGLIGSQAETAGLKVDLLNRRLKALQQLKVIAVTIAVTEILQHKKGIVDFFRENVPGFKGLQDFEFKHDPVARALDKLFGVAPAEFANAANAAKTGPQAEAAAKAAHGLGLALASRMSAAFESGFDEGTRKGGISVALRNRFFDNMIGRILLRGGLGDIQQQIGALEKANTLLAQRIKATKDVTRKLNLEDQLLQNQAQIQSLQAQATANAQQAAADALSKRQNAFSEFIANLQLGVTKAQVTSSFGDDLAALRQLETGIRQEIREFGLTADLAGQLFDVQQNILSTERQQRSAKLFRQLGFTATGEAITPGIANLKKQLESLSTRVDTPKLKSELARIRKVLAEGILPQDIRQRIAEMFDEIRQGLNKGTGNLDRFRHISTTTLLAGLGLDPATFRMLEQRISRLGVGGTIPANRSLAFAGAGATSNTYVTLVADGKVLAQVVTPHQRKQQQRRSDARRGSYAGRN